MAWCHRQAPLWELSIRSIGWWPRPLGRCVSTTALISTLDDSNNASSDGAEGGPASAGLFYLLILLPALLGIVENVESYMSASSAAEAADVATTQSRWDALGQCHSAQRFVKLACGG